LFLRETVRSARRGVGTSTFDGHRLAGWRGDLILTGYWRLRRSTAGSKSVVGGQGWPAKSAADGKTKEAMDAVIVHISEITVSSARAAPAAICLLISASLLLRRFPALVVSRFCGGRDEPYIA